MKEPFFSIIVPIYNVEVYLSTCLESLCEMKYNNVEFLLVDDGSTDGSSEICDRYGTRDSRFHVFHIKNRGVAGARNYGISRASGDYLLFVDSDDYVEKTYCEKIESAILREDPDVIVFAGIEENGREKEQLTVPFSKKRVVWNGHDFLLESYKTHSLYYQVWMYAYRREYIQKYDLRFVEGVYHEDVEFTPRALLNAKKILVLNDCLYHYRVRDGSISNLADKTKNIEDLFNVLRMQIKLAEGQEPRLRKWMLDMVVNSYLSMVQEARMYRSEYRMYLDKKILRGNAATVYNRIRVALYYVSVRLYCKINDWYKRTDRR